MPKDKVKTLINGEFLDSETDEWIDVTNPVGGHPCKCAHKWP